MYCQVMIVYGSPLSEDIENILGTMGLEPKDVGYETLYTGGGSKTPGYIGVELDGFDEATEMAMLVSSLKMKPTAAQKAAARTKFNALPKEVRDRAKPLDVYFIFYTS